MDQRKRLDHHCMLFIQAHLKNTMRAYVVPLSEQTLFFFEWILICCKLPKNDSNRINNSFSKKSYNKWRIHMRKCLNLILKTNNLS